MPRLPSLVVEVRDFAGHWALRAKLHGRRLAIVQRTLALCGSRGWISTRQLHATAAHLPLGERPVFMVSLALLIGLCVSLFFFADTRAVSALRTATTAACVALVCAYVPSLESRLFVATFRQFEVLYLLWSACVYAALAFWSQRELLVDDDKLGLAELVCTYAAVIWSAVWVTQVDSVILSSNDRKRICVGVLTALFALNGVRVLVRERFNDNDFSQSRVCLLYCARLRTLALSALSSYTFYMLKLAFYALRDSRASATAAPRMVTLRFPIYRSLTRGHQQLQCVMPRALMAKVFPRELRGRVSLEGERAVVTYTELPRAPVLHAPWMARLRKWRAYQAGAAVALLLSFVATAAGWTLEPVVASLSALSLAALLIVEACMLDTLMLAAVVSSFETWFLVLNALVFFATSTLGRIDTGKDNASSIGALLVGGLSAFLWVVTLDASSVARPGKALGSVFVLLMLLYIMLVELTDPHIARDRMVCAAFCASHAEVAQGALLNLSLFFAKNAAYLLWDGRQVIMCTAPGLPRPEWSARGAGHRRNSVLEQANPDAGTDPALIELAPMIADSTAASSSAPSLPPQRISLAHRDSLSAEMPLVRDVRSASSESAMSAATDVPEVALLMEADARGSAGAGARSNSRHRLSLLPRESGRAGADDS